jgi:hypothetical protein
MFNGAPASSSSYGEPSAGAPAEKARNVFKGTQPLDAQSLAEANRKGRTVRIPIAQRSGPTATPLPVEPSSAPQEAHGGPTSDNARFDDKRVIIDSSRADSGVYRGPNYQGAAGPPYSVSSPPSSAETLTPELVFQQGGFQGKGMYVLRGLLVGAGVGVLIALIVFLIRS